MGLLHNVMNKFIFGRAHVKDPSVLALQNEHVELRAKRDEERQLLRLSRAEYVDTLMKGVVSEIRGER